MTDLAGKVVVVTRSSEDAGPLSARLQALQAHVVAVPSVRLTAISPASVAMQKALEVLPHVAWIAFASRHGATFFCDFLGQAGCQVPDRARFAVVGPSTAGVVQRLGWRVSLVAQPSTGEGLAQGLLSLARPQDGAILLPAASAGRRVVYETLVAQGFTAHHVPIYHTLEASAADGAHTLPAGVHYVLFTSPSTVRGFLSRGAMPPGAVAVSIGPTTSAALRASGVKVGMQAREPSVEGLLQVLLEAEGT